MQVNIRLGEPICRKPDKSVLFYGNYPDNKGILIQNSAGQILYFYRLDEKCGNAGFLPGQALFRITGRPVLPPVRKNSVSAGHRLFSGGCGMITLHTGNKQKQAGQFRLLHRIQLLQFAYYMYIFGTVSAGTILQPQSCYFLFFNSAAKGL